MHAEELERRALRKLWLVSLSTNDQVQIKGWGGVPIGVGRVIETTGRSFGSGNMDIIVVQYPGGAKKHRFCRREGVSLDFDQFDLIEPAVVDQTALSPVDREIPQSSGLHETVVANVDAGYTQSA